MYFAVNILSYFLSYFKWMHVFSACTSVHVCAVLVEVACCGQFCRTSPAKLTVSFLCKVEYRANFLHIPHIGRCLTSCV